jgi:hypothetical protein
VWGLGVFVLGLPERVKIAGPLLLITVGAVFIIGFRNWWTAQKVASDAYRASIVNNPTAQALEVRSKWYSRMGLVAYALAPIWVLVGGIIFGNDSWQWIANVAIALIAVGFVLQVARSVVLLRGQYKSMHQMTSDNDEEKQA